MSEWHTLRAVDLEVLDEVLARDAPVRGSCRIDRTTAWLAHASGGVELLRAIRGFGSALVLAVFVAACASTASQVLQPNQIRARSHASIDEGASFALLRDGRDSDGHRWLQACLIEEMQRRGHTLAPSLEVADVGVHYELQHDHVSVQAKRHGIGSPGFAEIDILFVKIVRLGDTSPGEDRTLWELEIGYDSSRATSAEYVQMVLRLSFGYLGKDADLIVTER